MSSAQVTSQRGGLVEGRGQGSCLGSKLLCDCEGDGGREEGFLRRQSPAW